MKKKEKVGWPWDSQTVFIQNQLPDKKLYVMVTPNPDWVLADLLVSFVGIGSSALGIVKTASDLVRVLRTLSLIRNLQDVMAKLRTTIPQSSIIVPPRARVEVYNAYFSDPNR